MSKKISFILILCFFAIKIFATGIVADTIETPFGDTSKKISVIDTAKLRDIFADTIPKPKETLVTPKLDVKKLEDEYYKMTKKDETSNYVDRFFEILSAYLVYFLVIGLVILAVFMYLIYVQLQKMAKSGRYKFLGKLFEETDKEEMDYIKKDSPKKNLKIDENFRSEYKSKFVDTTQIPPFYLSDKTSEILAITNQIRELVAKDNLIDALTTLKEYFKERTEQFKPEYNEVIDQTGRLANLQNDREAAKITGDYYHAQIANIRHQILKFVEIIENVS